MFFLNSNIYLKKKRECTQPNGAIWTLLVHALMYYNSYGIINGEWFTPISLTREDGIAKTIVHLNATKTVLANELLCCSNGLLDSQSVKAEAVQ